MYEYEQNDGQCGQESAELNWDFELLKAGEGTATVFQKVDNERNIDEINLTFNWVADLAFHVPDDKTVDVPNYGKTATYIPRHRQDVIEVVEYKEKQPKHRHGLLDVPKVAHTKKGKKYCISGPNKPPFIIFPFIKDLTFLGSYRFILTTGNNEMLLLEDLDGRLSTFKAKRSIRNGPILETPTRAVSRVFNTTIQATDKITGVPYDHYGIGEDPGFSQYNYATMWVNIEHNNIVRPEIIGVFWVQFNRQFLGFNLRNFNQYQEIHFHPMYVHPTNMSYNELSVFYGVQNVQHWTVCNRHN